MNFWLRGACAGLVLAGVSHGEELRQNVPLPAELPGAAVSMAPTIAPDTAACSTGPVIAAYGVLIRCTPEECARALGPGRMARVVKARADARTPEGAVRQVTRLMREESVGRQVLGGVVVAARVPYARVYASDAGDGFALRLDEAGATPRLEVVEFVAGAPGRALARRELSPRQLLLTRHTIDGKDCLLCIFVEPPSDERVSGARGLTRFELDQRAFWESYRRLPAPDQVKLRGRPM